jgi:hypothetical protein
MSDHLESMEIDHRPGSIDIRAEAPGKFPFDAFNFDNPAETFPDLTLLSPWRFKALAMFVSGFWGKFNVLYKSAAGYAFTEDGITFLYADTGAANRTITLPRMTISTGRLLGIIKIDSAAGILSVKGYSTQTINGSTAKYLSAKWDNLLCWCTGTTWLVSGSAVVYQP